VAESVADPSASSGVKGNWPGDFHMPHGITVGADGAVCVGEVDGKRVQQFVAEGK
jgi:hypothetical protein